MKADIGANLVHGVTEERVFPICCFQNTARYEISVLIVY